MQKSATSLLIGALVIACVPPSEPDAPRRSTPKIQTAAPSATQLASAEPAERDGALPGPDEARERRAERLSARLLDGKIGWLQDKRAFLVITAFSEEGTGTGTTAEYLVERADPNAGNEEGEEALCEPGAPCDGDPDEILRAATDWVFDKGATDAIILEPIAFTSDKGPPTAEVGAIAARIVWTRDHLDVVRPKKPASLPKLLVDKEWTAKPVAGAASPDGKLLLVLFDMDPGARFAQGYNAFVETRVYKVP